jgi:hypothetical protein
MGRPRKIELGVTASAEFLYAVLDEFKPKNEAASIALREARTLLDVCVERAVVAHEYNNAS